MFGGMRFSILQRALNWSLSGRQEPRGLDGTFRPVDELQQICLQPRGVAPAPKTIAYCRIGERSSHTWFVLKYLLGLENVRNYHGSRTEYGNLVGAQIEKG